ncbi:MAG TPA: pyridoxal phosphate-dependent aminotransferase [Saprospiraceae bacterium]|nr:pyridoxal phosphate-dependent aminotransferase [Saprospiraceae bacterium]HMQ82083.1 pyridoxal phosphate-dependent aminotransferase [Saprospiraceae bacterium]
MAMVSTYPLSKRVMQMEESATLRMSQLARDLAAQGHKVINLSLGEPDFDTPVHIKEAAKQALDQGYTKYTPVPGLVELKKAIQEKFKRDNGLDFALNQIVVSNGAKQSIANICLSLLDEGDEVIILAPYWVSYSAIVELAGGKPILVKSGIEQDYKSTAEEIQAAITDRTKALLYSSPCNPTGSVYTKEELKAIADMIAQYEDIVIISDEIYEYINFGEKHFSIGAFENVKDRTVTVNGFAKGFAMTGWRLGYIGGPAWLADACTKIQGQVTSGATAFGQMAAAHALLADMQPTYNMREAFLRRRDLVIEKLSAIPGFKVNRPQGAFYIFPDISAYFGLSSPDGTLIRNSDDLCEYLLEKAHVAAVAGAAFGAENCFRISYAASEEDLITAIDRIGAAVADLK